jgi:hypothetical protein
MTINKRLFALALLGLLILVLFTAAFAWLVREVEGEAFLALAPWFVYPYLAVTSLYAGYFCARFAQGRVKSAWVWGLAGAALCLALVLGLPRFMAQVLPNTGTELFAGQAGVAFLAPLLAVLLLVLLISPRRRLPAEAIRGVKNHVA